MKLKMWNERRIKEYQHTDEILFIQKKEKNSDAQRR